MLPEDKTKYLKRLLKKERKLPENRCVVSASPLDHHRYMLYREIMDIAPGKAWKPSEPFVSLDELNAPYWNEYFETQKKQNEKTNVNARLTPKRRSSSVTSAKTMKRCRTTSLNFSEVVEPVKRKYGMCFEKAEMNKDVMAKFNADINKSSIAESSKGTVKLDDKPTSSSSNSWHKERTPVPHDDIIERWMKGEFDSPLPSFSGEK